MKKLWQSKANLNILSLSVKKLIITIIQLLNMLVISVVLFKYELNPLINENVMKIKAKIDLVSQGHIKVKIKQLGETMQFTLMSCAKCFVAKCEDNISR